ncbi:hypothetical protein AAFF_G00057760 [Aldrovandia affinis]|uniref:Uncharacterized protein n=1 Tax=Aldrovandia affinis TaxID=143900 RepID=A0AAD7S0M9_9TELE|nr:hypothetical protein AAFF_G00057760 [Aldrovandia affinis]
MNPTAKLEEEEGWAPPMRTRDLTSDALRLPVSSAFTAPAPPPPSVGPAGSAPWDPTVAKPSGPQGLRGWGLQHKRILPPYGAAPPNIRLHSSRYTRE